MKLFEFGRLANMMPKYEVKMFEKVVRNIASVSAAIQLPAAAYMAYIMDKMKPFPQSPNILVYKFSKGGFGRMIKTILEWCKLRRKLFAYSRANYDKPLFDAKYNEDISNLTSTDPIPYSSNSCFVMNYSDNTYVIIYD